MLKKILQITTLTLASTIGVPTLTLASDFPATIRLNGHHDKANGWEVSFGPGVYVLGNELFVGGDAKNEISLALLTEITYQRDNFYFLVSDTFGLVLGYTLLRDMDWTLDYVTGPKFGWPDNDELEVLNDRNVDFHAGLKLSHYKNNSLLTFEVSQGVSNEHNGWLLDLEYLHEFQIKNWVVTTGVAGALLSKEMTDYYFGIDENESSTKFPVYQAGASRVLFGRVMLEYPLTENWVFSANFIAGKADEQIKNSPVTQRDNFSALVTGLRYRF